ncbi:hypothetical protein SAMN05444064_10397 [Pseudomonas syringae]|nr:hypothetical protein SAMN05444514_10397 [Pseudomonas syringae]SFL65795.1 hypothetical protein SAMN05444064_10397 [Pseudomonas syringae]
MAKRYKPNNELWDLIKDLFESRRRSVVAEVAEKHV